MIIFCSSLMQMGKINALWLKWQPIETEKKIFFGDS